MAQATLNGVLRRDGGEACNCGFQWGTSIAYGNTTPTYSRRSRQGFSHVLSGLALNVEYHFRAFATNSAGTSYGADESFMVSELPPPIPPSPPSPPEPPPGPPNPPDPPPGPPYPPEPPYPPYPPDPVPGTKFVLTENATEITGRYATINGILMDDGGELCIVGFQWWAESSGFAYYMIVGTGVNSITHFSGLLQGLTPGTTYYFRALAADPYGYMYSYGAILSFTTEPAEEPPPEDWPPDDPWPPYPPEPPEDWPPDYPWPPDPEPPEDWPPDYPWPPDPEPPDPWVPYPPPPGRIAFDFLSVGIVMGGAVGIALPLMILPGEGPIAHTQPVVPYAEAAVLRGIIADDKGKECEAHFRWRCKSSWVITDWMNSLRTGYGFSTAIMGLAPGTRYEFQAQARHTKGKVKGPWSKSEYFTT